VAVSSCDKKVGKRPVADPTVINCDSVTYSKDIKPIIETSCAKAGCHDPVTKAGLVEFTSYAAVKAQADGGRIHARVIMGDPSFMPQDVGKLPDAQLKKIQCWLDQGSPEN
jgi:hypothetical protein